MKKRHTTLCLVILFISVALWTTGCGLLFGNNVYYTPTQDIGEIESIQVWYCDGMTDKTLEIGFVDPSQCEELINDLSGIPRKRFTPPTWTISGVVFTIQYKNGALEDVSSSGVYIHETDSFDSLCFDQEQYDALLKKYGYQTNYEY